MHTRIRSHAHAHNDTAWTRTTWTYGMAALTRVFLKLNVSFIFPATPPCCCWLKIHPCYPSMLLLLLLLLFISLDLLLIYCFDTFYLSINSSWLFLFPFLTGREWMAVARNGVSKHITSFVKPFLALLLSLHSCTLAFLHFILAFSHSRVRAIWFQRSKWTIDHQR